MVGSRGPLDIGDDDFFISNIARIAAAAIFRSPPDISSISRVGATCHDDPYRSVSQPHGRSAPPSASFFQNASISPWVSHSTNSEIASLTCSAAPR